MNANLQATIDELFIGLQAMELAELDGSELLKLVSQMLRFRAIFGLDNNERCLGEYAGTARDILLREETETL